MQFAAAVAIDVEAIMNKTAGDEFLESSLQKESSDGELIVYKVTYDTIAVPVLDSYALENISDFVHVKDFKCSLDNCRVKVKSKKHTLVVKGIPICPHSLLGITPVKMYFAFSQT